MKNFQPGVEDPLAMLSRYDTEMFWDETRDALIGVVEKAIQYDSDGIDLFFFNDPSNAINCNSPDQKVYSYCSIYQRVLDPYLTLLHQSKNGGPTIKPMNLIVLTDGEPDRGQDPEQVIVEIGRYLDSNRFPVKSIRYLICPDRNDSDNVITADFILKALIGGVNRKIDHLRL
ncbi:hypothetical protein H4Q26_013256 [Puccinia striiformis f. sp. tritici PST-130]|nr:hypothetical protein H4Q26_013256 [Puccinia striiformis f. sp. tritici PST-130]